MKMLEEIRQKFRSNDLLPGSGDGMLYLSARMHDAEGERREYEALATATENAALKIIGRYDPEAASEFYREVQALKARYLS